MLCRVGTLLALIVCGMFVAGRAIAEPTDPWQVSVVDRLEGPRWYFTRGEEKLILTGINKVQCETASTADQMWESAYGADFDSAKLLWTADVMTLLESRNINTIGHKSFWFDGGEDTAENYARIFARIFCPKDPPETCTDAERTTQYFMQDLSLPLHVNSEPTIRNTYYIAPVWFALDINHANRAAAARDAQGTGTEFDWFKYFDEYMPDMFEDDFTDRCETMARLIALPPEEDLSGDHRNLGLRDDPWLVAYYLGNEIYWFYQKNTPENGYYENQALPGAWDRKHYLRRLLMQPSSAAAWDAFVAAMRDFYAVPGEPENVSLWNDAYDEFDPDCTPPAGDLVIEEWDELYNFDQTWVEANYESCSEPPGELEGLIPGEGAWIKTVLRNEWDLGWFLWPDASLAFVQDVVEVYYATASTALRNADGDRHPIMSARFPLFPGDDSQIPLARIASQYCDVLCFNAYPAAGSASVMVNTLKNYYNALDYNEKRPFVITEFTYHADRSKGWDGCFYGGEPHKNCERPLSAFHYPEVNTDIKRGTRCRDYVNELYNEGKGNMYGVPAGHPALAYFIVGHLWHSLVDHAFFPATDGEIHWPEVSAGTQNWGLMRGIDDDNDIPSWDPYADFGLVLNDANQRVQCELLGHAWNGGTCP